MRQLDVREAISIFYRRRGLGTIIVLATLFGVLISNYVTYPVFESSIKILVERAPGFEIPFSREQIAFKKAEITQTQCELLCCGPVLEELVRRLKLHERPYPNKGFRDTIHAWGRSVKTFCTDTKEGCKRFVVSKVLNKKYTPPAPVDPVAAAINELRKHIKVEPIPNTDIIEVVVEDMDASLAASIANNIGDIYLQQDVASQRHRARQVYELIDAQVEAFKPSYDAAEKAVEDFEIAHHARSLKEQIRVKVAEISAMELTYGDQLEERKAKVLAAERELARVEQTYDSEHHLVQVARSDLREARRLLEPSTNGSEASGDASVSSLLAKIEQAKKELEELNRLDGAYARLQTKKEQEEGLFFKLKTKREEALIAEATRAAGTRIIEPARAAIKPVRPKKLLNLLMGLLGGLFLAGAYCALLEYLDRSVKTPEDIEEITGEAPVWSIPDWRRIRIFRG